MRIQSNISALNTWNAVSSALRGLETALRRLSSGERVTAAADDAAGLAVAEKLRSRLRGLAQGTRNARDAISLLQSTEGALQEVSSLLHRARELAVQSGNGTLGASDRTALQDELNQLLAEIDRIADTTSFNGIRLLSATGNNGLATGVLMGLRRSWLAQAEQLVTTHYGLAVAAPAPPLEIVFATSGEAAWISGTPGAWGRWDNVKLHINLAEFAPATWPDGGRDPEFNDRVVARAVTRAILARTTNYVALPEWFASGAADYIAGGDELLATSIAQSSPAAVVGALGTPWQDDQPHRAAAYVAVKYLDSLMRGLGGSIRDFMQMLAATSDLDTTFSTFGLFANTAGFLTDFLGNGTAFLNTLDLTDADVGAVGGGNKYTVIPDVDNYTISPLVNFQTIWPQGVTGTTREPLRIQVGAESDQYITIQLPEVTTLSLGLLGLDLVNKQEEALTRLDAALVRTAAARADLGTMQNRLEYTGAVNEVTAENLAASEGKIRNADMAEELMYLVRAQIIMSTGSAMLAQANRMPQALLTMLKSLAP